MDAFRIYIDFEGSYMFDICYDELSALANWILLPRKDWPAERG
jgi:hypothetical protein